MNSPHKILFVDDDARLLSGISRLLAFDFSTETALGGEEALEIVKTRGPFAIVVSDMRMPGMEGAELLEKIASIAPETVRIMLTGNIDQGTAVNAVNTGRVFRFLNKPVDHDKLKLTLEDGLKQYDLVNAKKELLEKTLAGSMRLLTDILGMVDPESFGKAQRTREMVREFCAKLHYSDSWQIEVGAMMASLGTIAVPASIALKVKMGASLSPEEHEILATIPQAGHDLLTKIPHLEPVAKVVLYQHLRYDAKNGDSSSPKGDAIPMGARVLKLLQDLQTLLDERADFAAAFSIMRRRQGMYDPTVLEDAAFCFERQGEDVNLPPSILLTGRCLRMGHVLAADLFSKDGSLLAGSGTTITPASFERLKSYLRMEQVVEPIAVYDSLAA